MKPTWMEYQIVTRDNSVSLVEAVNEALLNGWELFGHLIHHPQSPEPYIQAMTRPIEPRDAWS